MKTKYGFNMLWMYAGNYGRIPEEANERELDFIAEEGFNFIRIPTDYHFWTKDFDYTHPDEKVLAYFDRYVEACNSRGLHACLNIHRAPGYCINWPEREKHNLWREESMVLFVGYQSVGTLGRILVDGAKKVKLFGEEIRVAAQIDVLPGVSGHGDKNGLIRWLQGFDEKPELVFVNHGDPLVSDSFVTCLEKELGYHAFAPYSGTEFDLLTGRFTRVTKGIPVEKKAKQRSTSAAFLRLVAAAEKLLETARGLEGHANRELSSFADAVEKLTRKMEK